MPGFAFNVVILLMSCCIYASNAQLVCQREVFGSAVGGYTSAPVGVTCNVGESCGRIEGRTDSKPLLLNFLYG